MGHVAFDKNKLAAGHGSVEFRDGSVNVDVKVHSGVRDGQGITSRLEHAKHIVYHTKVAAQMSISEQQLWR